jgi:hypothetical protein
MPLFQHSMLRGQRLALEKRALVLLMERD